MVCTKKTQVLERKLFEAFKGEITRDDARELARVMTDPCLTPHDIEAEFCRRGFKVCMGVDALACSECDYPGALVFPPTSKLFYIEISCAGASGPIPVHSTRSCFRTRTNGNPYVKLVNLTPHEIVVQGIDGSTVTIPPSGTVARCDARVERRDVVPANGILIPLDARTFGEIEGLPGRDPGTLYITSALAAQAAWRAGRDDVVCPGEPKRDEAGRIVACVGLSVCP